MSVPKIIYSDKILNKLSWFMKIGGITIYPYIILREHYKKNKLILNHETIHIKQQAEMLVLLFYVWYLIEWILKLFIFGKKAYNNISFERESHANGDNLDYLKTRKPYSWLKYL